MAYLGGMLRRRSLLPTLLVLLSAAASAQDAPGKPAASPEPPKVKDEVSVEATIDDDDEGPATLPVKPGEVLTVAGSADNVFRALQTLPGVAATDEFGSRLAVRGGSPDQNLTVMDGVEIHNPYRLFGLTSAFN